METRILVLLFVCLCLWYMDPSYLSGPYSKHTRTISINKRWEFIHSYIQHGHNGTANITELSKEYRISRRHAYRLIDRFIKSGDVLSAFETKKLDPHFKATRKGKIDSVTAFLINEYLDFRNSSTLYEYQQWLSDILKDKSQTGFTK
eukprot:196004_1